MPTIHDLFVMRDAAVGKHDIRSFQNTQLSQIIGPIAEAYTSLSRLVTDVIAEAEDEPGVSVVVFVKETYYQDDTRVDSNFVVYGLINTAAGWRIYSAAHLFPRKGPWSNIPPAGSINHSLVSSRRRK
jgi:hypothetical protein